MNKILSALTLTLPILALADIQNSPGAIRLYGVNLDHALKQINNDSKTNNAGQIIEIPTQKFPGDVQKPRLSIQAQKVTVEGKTVKIYGAFAEFKADYWKYKGSAGRFVAVQIDCNDFIARMNFENPLSLELPEEIQTTIKAKNGSLAATVNFDIEAWTRKVIGPYFEMANLEKNLGIDASRCSGSDGSNKDALLGIMAAQLRAALNKLPEADSSGFSREVKTLIPHLNRAIESTLAKENVILPQALDLNLTTSLKYENNSWVLQPKGANDMESTLSPMAKALLSKNRARMLNDNQSMLVEAVLSRPMLKDTLSLLIEPLQRSADKIEIFKKTPTSKDINDIKEIGASAGELSISFSGMTCEEQKARQFLAPWVLGQKNGAFRQGLDINAPVVLNIYNKDRSQLLAQRWAEIRSIIEFSNSANSVKLNINQIALVGSNAQMCGIKGLSQDDASSLSALSFSENYMNQSNKELQKNFSPKGETQFMASVLLPGEIPQKDASMSGMDLLIASLKRDSIREQSTLSDQKNGILFNSYGEALVLFVKNPLLNNNR